MPPGTLFVVATPIGNLEDITLRALRVLRESDLIAAEDTRRTAKLLMHHGITTPSVSFHAHNLRTRLPQLMLKLRAGNRLALVSDAGTPGISDPGVELVQACVSEGIPVDPVPGVSAVLTAAVGSGFALAPLTILGFAPPRSNDRKRFLQMVSGIDHTVVLFEAPTRIQAFLEDAAIALGQRPIVLGRELTKLHQEFLRGHAAELIPMLAAPKGEFTVVVGPSVPAPQDNEPASDADVAAIFGDMSKSVPGGRRAVVAAVAKKLGMSSRHVYTAIERHKASGQ